MENKSFHVAAFLLAVGLILGGWFIGNGFVKSRMADRYVTVKGVSERDVEADIGLWPIRFVSTDDNLALAQSKIKKSRDAIMDFLERYGIRVESVEVQKLEVNDALANQYVSGQIQSRYIITQTLMVRTKNPELFRKASQKIGELVDAGVILPATYGPESGPIYLFTRLNDIKPEMIVEATATARESALQFAKDSGSELGGIRRAYQGVFVIQPRNPAPGVMEESEFSKTVRVVSTVEYYLED
ncbi:protein of unknown function DUF541 [Chloroherpeton thalassium ATCC 35110]|uniref:SIMPL domain-containing protein n=1 Tax=Chloroherpeton thalassium (strain ATCC 35110 / GB-78) TaxID=517418 RepID=B3QTR3_CHLT3|nr:SIMPL domain-containing protein [Chloroherpeton thalassium]ACF14261.1 protein of unknown function DUF541 [Chloroherpeton thalassium ATCC 35110]